jgi:hypothetical protein
MIQSWSKIIRAQTPLARRFRAARRVFQDAERALRRSCESSKRLCGYPTELEHGLRARSMLEMKSEFLEAPTSSGTNEDVIRTQLGHLGVRDTVQWESVAAKYDTGPLRTFDEAFAVVAKRSRRRGYLEWDRFDIGVLRSCPGLEALELPSRVEKARAEDLVAQYYGEVPF